MFLRISLHFYEGINVLWLHFYEGMVDYLLFLRIKE